MNKINCPTKLYNHNQPSYYKRDFCCCKSCEKMTIDENIHKFEQISNNTYKCKICNEEIFDFNLLTHINSLKHLILEVSNE
jgi:hypothetical protein